MLLDSPFSPACMEPPCSWSWLISACHIGSLQIWPWVQSALVQFFGAHSSSFLSHTIFQFYPACAHPVQLSGLAEQLEWLSGQVEPSQELYYILPVLSLPVDQNVGRCQDRHLPSSAGVAVRGKEERDAIPEILVRLRTTLPMGPGEEWLS